MASQNITNELRAWILEQAQAGHSVQSILAAMKASGWQESVAMTALEETLEGEVSRLRASGQKPMPQLQAEPSVSEVWAHDRMVKVLLTLRHPQVVLLGGFLSDEECEQLRRDAQPKLDRSQTVATASGGSEVNEARTSQGMFFQVGESALCQRIESRIEALFGWPVERGEGIQVLRYLPGAEYKPHFDYFDPTKPSSASILARGGQRVGTLVMYLNTPEKGGATVFPEAGLDVQALQGNAVFFAYPDPSPTTLTLHGGAPVVSGEKWVATKWMRESRFE